MRATAVLSARPALARLLTTTMTALPGDLRVSDHLLSVPLDHAKPDGPRLSLFVA